MKTRQSVVEAIQKMGGSRVAVTERAIKAIPTILWSSNSSRSDVDDKRSRPARRVSRRQPKVKKVKRGEDLRTLGGVCFRQ